MLLSRPLTRRSLLLGSAALAACSQAPRSATTISRGETKAPKRILILGGTQFLGPEIVEIAGARGHKLTLFNRGKTNPQLFPNIEKLHGDRNTGDLAALDGRTWDAVIDTSGYFPRAVNEAAAHLASASQYVFISTISVFEHPPKSGVDETGAVGKLDDPNVEKVDGKTYGPLKAACERAAEAKFPGRATIIRPGLIVGPGDPTDRFTYWPVRLDAGGDVLAPGQPSDPVQVIDVRDLAAFVVLTVERDTTGTFNAVRQSEPIGTMLGEVAKGVGSSAKLTWVDAAFLESKKVAPWSDMPVWIPGDSEDAGMARVDVRKALAAGLTFRPLSTTARDTIAWWKEQPEERRAKKRGGLSREREREVLEAFRARG
jgi:2'-hydroxyisoflavone reductase